MIERVDQDQRYSEIDWFDNVDDTFEGNDWFNEIMNHEV